MQTEEEKKMEKKEMERLKQKLEDLEPAKAEMQRVKKDVRHCLTTELVC